MITSLFDYFIHVRYTFTLLPLQKFTKHYKTLKIIYS